jgi:DNA-binding CsgD family transcriptional regulator
LADRNRGRTGAIARWALGYVALGRGEHAAAADHLNVARRFGEQAEWADMTIPALWGLAENALLAGDPEAAIGLTHDALISAARGPGAETELIPCIVTGTRARLAAGKPEEASAWLLQVSAALEARPELGATAIAHATGLLRLSAGSLTAAIAAMQSAVEGWVGRGRAWEASWARLDLAGALLRANRYVDAAAQIAEVRPVAQALTSRPLRDRINELDSVAHGRGAEQAAWHPLTQREYEIARKVAAGLTNPEIARELFLSPKTISAHVEHILAKLNVARRAEIAAWASSIRAPEPRPAAAEPGLTVAAPN